MTIQSEIMALRNLSATVLPKKTKYLLQQDLKVSAVDYLAIKRMNAEYGNEMTSRLYSNTFDYRFVLYANTELDVHSQAEQLGRLFSQDKKIPLTDENAWITLGSFATSESFETEKTGVFAIMGMISATRYEVKTKQDAELLERIYVRYEKEIKL